MSTRKWSNKTAKYKILYRERQEVFNKGPKSTACILCIDPNQTKKPMWVIQHHIKKNPMKDPVPLNNIQHKRQQQTQTLTNMNMEGLN
jgi:predicted nuclease of restriction endonuclease-like (RecB) superfamily